MKKTTVYDCSAIELPKNIDDLGLNPKLLEIPTTICRCSCYCNDALKVRLNFICRDFTYIENVIQANEKALLAETDKLKAKTKNEYFSQVFNVAFGGNTTLVDLVNVLKENLAKFDAEIAKIEPIVGPNRVGDIPHSQASIEKARTMLNYQPKYSAVDGFERACE